MRNNATTRYFFQSPSNSRGMRLMSGFLIFFFFMTATLLTTQDLLLKSCVHFSRCGARLRHEV